MAVHDNEAELLSTIVETMYQCEQYTDQQAEDRQTALDYYHGDMSDIHADDGRSSVVSKDVRAIVRKLMPSVMRSLFGNDNLVEYEANAPGQEEQARQATEYVNKVVIPNCGAEDALYDAVYDAMLLRTGILKWYAVEDPQYTLYEYTGYDQELAAVVLDQPHTEAVEVNHNEDGTVNMTVRVTEQSVKIMLEAIRRSSFLIHPHKTTIEGNAMVGERVYHTRSELMEMGYDRAVVDGLMAAYRTTDDHDDQYFNEDIDREFLRQSGSSKNMAMEDVLVYILYCRLDMDDDGIAELYQVTLAESNDGLQNSFGQGYGYTILDMEEVEEAPYGKVVIERRAHSFDGHSIADDMVPIQRIKTVLLRETMDNIYWQNTPQPAVDKSKVEDLDSVMNPQFGRPIFLKPGAKVLDALQFTKVPFVGDKTMEMLDYMDRMSKERTGITDMSGGVDPSKFQEMSATGANILAESGTAQAEMIVRILTKGGIKKAFQGILKLVTMHTDKVYKYKKGQDWVEYNPATWDPSMTCMVNVGLGAGSKDKDMEVLGLIRGIQSELVTAFGLDNPFVTPDHIYNLIEKIVLMSGFPTAEPYFMRPDPENVKRLMEASQQGDDTEQQKMQMQMQVEQMKLQSKHQEAVLKAEAQAHIEQAQMEADHQIELSKLQSAQSIEAVKAVHVQQLENMKASHARGLEMMRLEHDESMRIFESQAEDRRHAAKLAVDREKADKQAEAAASRARANPPSDR